MIPFICGMGVGLTIWAIQWVAKDLKPRRLGRYETR